MLQCEVVDEGDDRGRCCVVFSVVLLRYSDKQLQRSVHRLIIIIIIIIICTVADVCWSCDEGDEDTEDDEAEKTCDHVLFGDVMPRSAAFRYAQVLY